MTDKAEEYAKELGVELKAPKVTPDFVAAMIEKEEYFVFPHTTHTVCALTLYNGFRVLGESACASPENFNDEIGRRFAKENAIAHLWPFAGFWLRQKIWQDTALVEARQQQFWIEKSRDVNPALPHIDATREANSLGGTVFESVAEVKAELDAVTGGLFEAGLLEPGEAAKITAGKPYVEDA